MDILDTRKESLMVPSAVQDGDWASIEAIRDQVYQALIGGQERALRRQVMDLLEKAVPLYVIFDRLITPVFQVIGEGWQQKRVMVFQERMSVEMISRLLYELRHDVLPSQVAGPLAMGATLPGDRYHLALHMVELALRGEKWQAQSLGTNLPGTSLAVAIQQFKPQLFWLSISYVDTPATLLEELRPVRAACKAHNCLLAIGGQAIDENISSRIAYDIRCSNITDLVTQLPEVA